MFCALLLKIRTFYPSAYNLCSLCNLCSLNTILWNRCNEINNEDNDELQDQEVERLKKNEYFNMYDNERGVIVFQVENAI